MASKNYKIALGSFLTLLALLIGVVSGGVASAHPVAKNASGVQISSKKAGAFKPTSMHTVNMHSLPTIKNVPAKVHNPIPFHSGSKYAQAKKNASTNKNAPKGGAALADTSAAKKSSLVKTGFNGMADSATICPYFGGCQPPDMALATSSTLVLQGVNTSFAFYDTHGNLVAGPINSVDFFGVPPLPNNCDPNGPFMSDPRAFYDINTGLFWAAMLQVEGSPLGNTCPNTSIYWIANINPSSGTMHVYAFDMTLGGTVSGWADYTQFGFNRNVIAFSGNIFDFTTGGFDFAEVQFADKHAMEQGQPVTSNAFTNLDAISTTGTVEYLINSFNIFGDPFGNDCFFTACQGFVTWAYDPTSGSLGGSFVNTVVPNPSYVVAPNADEPGCLFCIETLDTRISATPVYSVGGGQGLISFALDTGVTNGGTSFPNVVPGILWGEVQVTHFSSTPSANLYQSSYLFFANDRAASFGATMQDKNGNLFMVFDTMSANLNPSIMLAKRSKSDPLGMFSQVGFIIKGPSATSDTRWGDYEAASYSGFNSNHVWVASQYSISGDWATYIARVS